MISSLPLREALWLKVRTCGCLRVQGPLSHCIAIQSMARSGGENNYSLERREERRREILSSIATYNLLPNPSKLLPMRKVHLDGSRRAGECSGTRIEIAIKALKEQMQSNVIQIQKPNTQAKLLCRIPQCSPSNLSPLGLSLLGTFHL
jgi:hypothetical protein